ncbi:MAG: hypothetical protein ACLP1Q_15450 [Solirubrobacteraceae bacterium]
MSALRRERVVRGLERAALASALLCFGVLATAASAGAGVPSFASVLATPRVLPSDGGQLTISAFVRGATACTLHAGALGPPRAVGCASGRVSFRLRVPANTRAVPIRRLVYVEAHGLREESRSREIEVETLPRKGAPGPPVRDLDACATGPHCDYGAAYERFPTWGNVAPQSLGDCAFAAAADWEQIVLGVHAAASVIGSEFAQAGGNDQTGLAQAALWSYWQHEGIAGTHLTALHSYTTDRADVENAVRSFAAMIVELSFATDDQLAQYNLLPLELHDVVLDGFTPAGPLVVTWGQTLQMTWAQWDQEASSMWAVTAS